MRRRPLLLGGLVTVAALVVAMVILWPHWVFLWDGFGHRGFFRCSSITTPEGRVRLCVADVDEVVFEEKRSANGATVQSWFVGGALEYARMEQHPGKAPTLLRRQLGENWALGTASTPPFGRTTCVCERGQGGPE